MLDAGAWANWNGRKLYLAQLLRAGDLLAEHRPNAEHQRTLADADCDLDGLRDAGLERLFPLRLERELFGVRDAGDALA